jgi:hypothetical protein
MIGKIKSLLLVITAITLCTVLTNAQAPERLDVYIRGVANYKHELPVHDGNAINLPKQKPIIDKTNLMSNLWEVENQLSVWENSIVVIRVFNQTTGRVMTMGELGSIVVTVVVDYDMPGPVTVRAPALTLNEKDMTDFTITFDESHLLAGPAALQQLRSLKGNPKIMISFKINNPNYVIANSNEPDSKSETGYFHASKIEKYGAGGFWIPMLAFSTNGKSTANGIPFASLPIGLAWGGKLFVKRSHYIGASLMGNWLIYNQPSNSLPDVNTSSFTVKALTYGIMFDFDNYGGVGVVYGRNFQKGVPNPRYMATINFGPALIQLLKGKSKSGTP